MFDESDKPSSQWLQRDGSGRSPADHTLTGAYRLLSVLLLVSIAAALLLPKHTVTQQFAPNAATEVFGIILTLAFVQQLLYRQERARRMRSSIGAYRRAGWALTRLVTVLANTIKGCHRGDVALTLDRLFAPHVTEVMTNLNPLASTGGDEPVTWARTMAVEIDAAIEQLNRVVLSYSSVLEPAYTEAVDEIIDHPYLKFMGELTHAPHAVPQQWRTMMNLNRGHREDFFSHLLATVHLHNRLAAEASTVRSRGRAPRSGTLGMELARDHDLHVSTELGSSWLAGTPRPAALSG